MATLLLAHMKPFGHALSPNLERSTCFCPLKNIGSISKYNIFGHNINNYVINPCTLTLFNLTSVALLKIVEKGQIWPRGPLGVNPYLLVRVMGLSLSLKKRSHHGATLRLHPDSPPDIEIF